MNRKWTMAGAVSAVGLLVVVRVLGRRWARQAMASRRPAIPPRTTRIEKPSVGPRVTPNYDEVDQASMESFPASDPPGHY